MYSPRLLDRVEHTNCVFTRFEGFCIEWTQKQKRCSFLTESCGRVPAKTITFLPSPLILVECKSPYYFSNYRTDFIWYLKVYRHFSSNLLQVCYYACLACHIILSGKSENIIIKAFEKSMKTRKKEVRKCFQSSWLLLPGAINISPKFGTLYCFFITFLVYFSSWSFIIANKNNFVSSTNVNVCFKTFSIYFFKFFLSFPGLLKE